MFYCLLFSPAFLSFPKTPVLSLCARSRTAAVLSFFTYSDVSGLICCRGKKKKKKIEDPLVRLPGGPGYPCASLPTPYFERLNCPHPPSSLFHFRICTESLGTRGRGRSSLWCLMTRLCSPWSFQILHCCPMSTFLQPAFGLGNEVSYQGLVA